LSPPPLPTGATLGELPFSLSADELRRRGAAILAHAGRRLDDVLAVAGGRTLSNLLEPLDRLLLQVRDLSSHAGLMFYVHPEEATRVAGREVSEAADRFFNAFRLNESAYRALRELDLSDADAPTRFAVEKMLREMRRAGVEKDAEGRARILALTNEIDLTANEFSEVISRSRRSITVDGPAELPGLPQDYIAAHAPNAEGKIRITTDYPDFRPVITYCENAEVRRRILYEFANRAYPENVPVLARLLSKRYEFARSLGYSDYAAYAIEDKMMRSPEAAAAFLDRVGRLLRLPAEADLERRLDRKRKDDPAATRLENWDAGLFGEGYYDAKLRSEEAGVDTKLLRPYLPYGQVRDGLFQLCTELFGLTFLPVSNAELWHPSVEAFDVTKGGRPVGRCYLDMVPREGKYNHAACFGVREGLETVQLPQSALICNFLDPGSPRETALMEYGDVVTFFHEFGHLLHALLSGHGRWLYNGQGAIEWDFVEAPSQLFEEWARDPATLNRFARNPGTGERIPADLLARLKFADAMGRPSRWLRQVALAEASLRLYDRDPSGLDAGKALKAAFNRHFPLPLREEYHPETSFGHLTGYSACYYTYVWSLVIARDLLRPFYEKGTLTDRAIAERYATEILAAGSSRPAAELIRAYLGREFNFEAFEGWVREEESSPAPGRPTARTP
jgi:thimet oligopeptidase